MLERLQGEAFTRATVVLQDILSAVTKEQFACNFFQFRPSDLDFDLKIAEDPAAVRQTLHDYMVAQTTEVIRFYRTREQALKAVEIFSSLWLDKASDRAVQTLYAGLSGKVDVSPQYLLAVELLEDMEPLPMTHSIPVIYFKTTGGVEGNAVLESVIATSTRADVSSWATDAITAAPPAQEAVSFLDTLWNGAVPFELRSPSTMPYQVGRSIAPLAQRAQLEQLGLQDVSKLPGQRCRWLASVTAAGVPTVYRSLFLQTSSSELQRKLEQVSCLCAYDADMKQTAELYGALLLRCPKSTTMQCPSLDLRSIDPLDEDDRESVASDDSREEEEAAAVPSKYRERKDTTIDPPRRDLMMNWRRVLSDCLSQQGLTFDEVDVEVLHYLGYKGSEISAFLKNDAAFYPHGLCQGVDRPFFMKFTASGGYLRASTNFFVVGMDASKKVICLRPGSFADQPRLPRPPDFPRSFVSSRVPVDMGWSVKIDDDSPDSWCDVYELAESGSVAVKVVLTKLPGGGFGLALPGGDPVVHRAKGSHKGAPKPPVVFWEPILTHEAKLILDGVHPTLQKVRELSFYNDISSLASHQVGPTELMSRTLVTSPETENLRLQLTSLFDLPSADHDHDAVLDLAHVSTS